MTIQRRKAKLTITVYKVTTTGSRTPVSSRDVDDEINTPRPLTDSWPACGCPLHRSPA
ncbi:hypothetical protein P3T29_000188 [Kitasatospora sp. MAP5-34]|nr:hypothetical protein [Kitasatospora sp. MAP5-34]